MMVIQQNNSSQVVKNNQNNTNNVTFTNQPINASSNVQTVSHENNPRTMQQSQSSNYYSTNQTASSNNYYQKGYCSNTASYSASVVNSYRYSQSTQPNRIQTTPQDLNSSQNKPMAESNKVAASKVNSNDSNNQGNRNNSYYNFAVQPKTQQTNAPQHASQANSVNQMQVAI